MLTTYKIHPGIGIARLGNSPDEFCLSPEKPAALPIECDSQGNPLMSPDGLTERTTERFKDAEGRIKRQGARFQIYVYDEESPEGRPMKLGDPVSGGGNQGFLVDIQWRTYLANKKSSWYEFKQLEGEHGYAPDHPRRNADITADEARQQLIIDPGPRIVDCTKVRAASFDRDGRDVYATTFPPPLQPCSIDTLGEIKTDDSGRLIVLGGHGHSGTFKADQFGQPRIDTYANNDGWFDDTSDGPVTARLVMYSPEVGATRFIDVEYPAWVIVGYPRYAPEMLDMVTMDDVVLDMSIQQFAYRTDLYGKAGTFQDPQVIPPTDTEALVMWKANKLRWNPDYKPWFYRDIWPILFRADQFSYLTSILGQSNFPHNQSPRGSFDPYKMSVPPMVDKDALAACDKDCLAKHHSGELFVDELAPAVTVLEKQSAGKLFRAAAAMAATAAIAPQGQPLAAAAPTKAAKSVNAANAAEADISTPFQSAVQKALAEFARTVLGKNPGSDYNAYLRKWRAAAETPEYPKAKEDLEQAVQNALARVRNGMDEELWQQLRVSTSEHLKKYHTGKLLEECRVKCLVKTTSDPYRSYRQFLFDILRQPGEENVFRIGSKPSSRVHGLPLMPLLCGDNPISNTLPSKFLALTPYQYYLLRQWSLGLFYSEELEGWGHPDPWNPYTDWVNRTGRDLDMGVLSNVLGGAFCPGGEVGWILRNPAVYLEPYRIKVDPGFSSFRQTAAQANANHGNVPEADYSAYVGDDLSQDDNFDAGMQPGDLTKHMGIPWQADFNECSTQPINVTYAEWNQIYPASEGDSLMVREEKAWETLWWPAHRPLQVWEPAVVNGSLTYLWLDWSRGIPQTNAGDLKMVTEWWKLAFVIRTPGVSNEPSEVPPPSPPPYIAVERTAVERTKRKEDA